MELKKTIKTLVLTALIAIGIITALYVSSDDIMAHENPFIRRFMQSSITKTAETDLKNYSFYFAGAGNGKIFLGNNQAPLQIVTLDSTLEKREQYTIQLDRDDLPFRSIQVKIVPPYFYVMDGTVPVIYKGNISDWKAKIIMNENHYFSKAVIIDSDVIAFRTQQFDSKENIIGIFTFKDSVKVKFADDILEKQIDGIFDTDGMLHYSKELERLIYLYYYRNQFIVTNDNLKVLYRGNTIDTTTRAKLKPIQIKNSGEMKLGAQPYTVNLKSTVSNNLLFVNSGLRGRFEDGQMWKKASVIDMYDIANNTYLSSFYLYNFDDYKMTDFLATKTDLYVIIGHHLQKFKFRQNLIHRISNTKSDNKAF
ncbi:hypothetical protein [Flavobacterium xinjiangense]|uniref:Uncharacterized protein n=1 Tax=Flavobacterium xinjiangense TaxID=178356 RepID=A0A1M7P722_9FLAO|nr:hypothetical protein [Flavobacterium xinjiangense]SHN11956.1 hypothetical protein SAMN05216269_11416 [Flavobacterium xinjiangense]